eukprot:NODE_11500_length_280_cov_206.466667.p3 GENE.NODE_11500_length_280_cov_206.466667~~NODE_11500_length_280_cov_206.466667.p3  ORF type:complete len:61 (-),score=6.05 NODE_11500_length_280_cov_206.466667:80-262(-)
MGEASADKAGVIDEIVVVRKALANFDQAVAQQFREYQANRREESAGGHVLEHRTSRGRGG